MTTKEFIEKRCDIDFIKKMEEVRSFEEIYVFAKRYGVTDSIQAFYKEIREQRESSDRKNKDCFRV